MRPTPRAEQVEDEIGDLMFAAVNLARHMDIDPDSALRRANRKFERRFGSIEAALAAQNRSPETGEPRGDGTALARRQGR